MKVLKRGSKGKAVERWQFFLRGLEFYTGPTDGDFGPLTEKATRLFQQAHVFGPDLYEPGDENYCNGIVGERTLGAAMAIGFTPEVIIYPAKDAKRQEGPNWPARPDGRVLRPLNYQERDKLFGRIVWKPAATKKNPERIIVTNNWNAKHLEKRNIPQLKRLAKMKPQGGFPKSGNVFVNKVICDSIVELFGAIDEAGKLPQLISYGGLFAQRLCRGSETTLSNHAYATAVDLNVWWNMIGKRPALMGMKGCLREIVPIMAELGWWWGGWGWPKHYHRLDGMHCEPGSKLLKRLGLL
jgi:hypothetical protein